MIYINKYGIFIIAFAICFILHKISFTNDFIQNLLKSQNITSIFQSTITCVSILIGFLGTLLSQIINLKNKEQKTKNKVSEFFSSTNDKTISNTIFSCIVSGIIIIFFSLILLTNDIMNEATKSTLIYFWIYFFMIFIYYDISVYYVFISILFDSTEINQPLDCSDTIEDVTKCMHELQETKKKQ